MKLVKSFSGKTKIKMSQKEWVEMGKRAGWLKESAYPSFPGYDNWKTLPDDYYGEEPEEKPDPRCPKCDKEMYGDGMGEWRCDDKECDGIVHIDPHGE